MEHAGCKHVVKPSYDRVWHMVEGGKKGVAVWRMMKAVNLHFCDQLEEGAKIEHNDIGSIQMPEWDLLNSDPCPRRQETS